jgi:phosphotransferase system enzyme I (PtsI)
MVEVPAAALCVENLIDYTQFVSIGTNDLTQYLTAADRDNSKVSHLCDPLSPAVLQVLDHVISVCNRRGVPVSVCGEMAGRPGCVLALLSFGLKSFSMSPAFVPLIKELIHSVSLKELASVREAVLKRRTNRLVRKYLNGVLRHVNPRLAMLEYT